MNCRDFREIIDSYLSSELLTETNHDVLRHLEDCATCRDEIEARRMVRSQIRSAVRNESQYQLSEKFNVDLAANLRSSFAKLRSSTSFYSNNRSWLAVAASLLVVLTVGIVFLSVSDGVGGNSVAETNLLISDLPSSHIVNIALGDHEYCGINHGKDKDHPVYAARKAVEYKGMEKAILPSVKKVLVNYDLTDSHYCKYKDVEFAHLVLKKEENTVSILVSSLEGHEKLDGAGIQKFNTDRYRVSRFDTDKRAIFVVSNLNEQQNLKASQALFEPMQKHFLRTDNESLQTTLLTAF